MSIGDFFTKQQLFIDGVSAATGVVSARIEIVEIQIVADQRRRSLTTQLQIVLELLLILHSQIVSVMSNMASEKLSAKNAKNGIPPLQITGFKTITRLQIPSMTTPGPRETLHTTIVNHNTNTIVQNHTQTEIRHRDNFPLFQVLIIIFLNIGVAVCVFSYTYYRTWRLPRPVDLIREGTPEHAIHAAILVNV
jgi:hypothetical protein